MNASAGQPLRSLACRDVGFPCEWSIRSASGAEIESRYREHAKCAHPGDAGTPALAERVERATRTLS
jgi:predicted small metal-binding protein